jgi:hypothetical protein
MAWEWTNLPLPSYQQSGVVVSNRYQPLLKDKKLLWFNLLAMLTRY